MFMSMLKRISPRSVQCIASEHNATMLGDEFEEYRIMKPQGAEKDTNDLSCSSVR
eukprot:m.153191 g.153191  ORF g.153191 m.153191 type:complete len:55 (-) comp17908_c0_seq1:128-292(-)